MGLWERLFGSRKEVKRLKQAYAEEISRKEREIVCGCKRKRGRLCMW